MIGQKRRGLSAEQKAELWKRWKAGQSLNEIGRALGKDHVVIQFVLARHGGIVPPARRRSRRVLTLAEREDISRGIASGCSMRIIAQGLRRPPSTVSREVARHGGRPLYRASEADQLAWQSALRPKPCLLATHSHLRELVAGKLMQDWSPQQIAGWLKMEYPNKESLRVSHETIYRSLFIQARGALKQELVRHLRSKRRIRRSRHASVHGHSQGRIIDAISIRERPAEVEDRAIPGHWEGDLLRGAGNLTAWSATLRLARRLESPMRAATPTTRFMRPSLWTEADAGQPLEACRAARGTARAWRRSTARCRPLPALGSEP